MYFPVARILCILGLCLCSAESAKILMAAWPMPSHIGQLASLDSELKKLGHQVDHLLPETFPPGLQKKYAKSKHFHKYSYRCFSYLKYVYYLLSVVFKVYIIVHNIFNTGSFEATLRLVVNIILHRYVQ